MSFNEEFVDRHSSFAQLLRKKHVYGDPVIMQGQIGADVIEASTGREAACFTCLDYLGFGKFLPVQQHMAKCILEIGTATIGSRVIMDSNILRDFERELADFKGSEDCMLVSSGYTASSCLISIIANEVNVAGHRLKKRKKTYIYVDKLAHASIQEGLFQFRHKKDGKVEVYLHKHLDYEQLEGQIMKNANEDADRFIVADSLFSMNGSRPDCMRLYDLAKEYGAIVILDGAHCDGVFGSEGRGILFEPGFNDEKRKLFYESGTVSKTMASIGGYITLPHSIADLARVSQWRNIFSTALPTALVQADRFTLSLIRSEEGEKRRMKIMHLGTKLLSMLKTEGFDTGKSSTYIIPVTIGDEVKCLQIQDDLFNSSSVIVGAIRFPAVERGQSILRIALTAEHDEYHLEVLVKALKNARDKFRF